MARHPQSPDALLKLFDTAIDASGEIHVPRTTLSISALARSHVPTGPLRSSSSPSTAMVQEQQRSFVAFMSGQSRLSTSSRTHRKWTALSSLPRSKRTGHRGRTQTNSAESDRRRNGPQNTVAERANVTSNTKAISKRRPARRGVKTPPSWDVDLVSMVHRVGEPFKKVFLRRSSCSHTPVLC
jgi:hypothetical protein